MSRPFLHQRWESTTFASWAVPPDALRARVPHALDLDLHDGSAWISLVALRVARVRVHPFARLPVLPPFAELNVRTYVRSGDQRGVWFLRVVAGNRLAAVAARLAFRAPFRYAPIRWHEQPDGYRIDGSLKLPNWSARRLDANLHPSDPALTEFLTNRDVMFTPRRKGLYFATVNHEPWRLHDADVVTDTAALFDAIGLARPLGRPVVHLASSTSTSIDWRRRYAVATTAERAAAR